jgi:hypothetical protein
VQSMKAADLNRFLVVCALVSDLYCPGYNPRQSLEKTSNLGRVATRCKVDSAKMATTVRAELTEAKNKMKHVTHSGKGPTSTTHQSKALARTRAK